MLLEQEMELGRQKYQLCTGEMMKLIGAKCSLRVAQLLIIASKALSLKLKLNAFDKGRKQLPEIVFS